jgi:hypothetical protein
MTPINLHLHLPNAQEAFALIKLLQGGVVQVEQSPPNPQDLAALGLLSLTPEPAIAVPAVTAVVPRTPTAPRTEAQAVVDRFVDAACETDDPFTSEDQKATYSALVEFCSRLRLERPTKYALTKRLQSEYGVGLKNGRYTGLRLLRSNED